jgi:ribosomal protein S18 acetylase RimI-like enzyme
VTASHDGKRQRAAGGRADVRDVQIREWSGPELSARVNDAMAIYVLAMNYPGYAGSQRSVTTRRHTTNRGFTCRAALRPDGTLVGFAYGYTTAAGQWWHDLVRKALPPRAAAEWMVDAFELSEIHVLPTYQAHGIGRQILLSLAAGVPHRSMLLSTPDADTRAFRLYRALGFQDLARNYLFPGDARPFAVLGARLPLTRQPWMGPRDAARS